MEETLRDALQLPPCDQVGFVVRDIEASMAMYEPLFGPFTTMDPGPMTYLYRGAQEESEIKIAFGSSLIKRFYCSIGCFPSRVQILFFDGKKRFPNHGSRLAFVCAIPHSAFFVLSFSFL